LKIDFFSNAMEINVKGTMLCVRAVTQAMIQQEPLTHTSARHSARSLRRGSIVNLASINSYIGAPGMMPYTTSKHAVIGITKTAGKPLCPIAMDCAKNHMCVIAVCPSWVDTPMMQASLKRVPQLGQLIQTASPLHRAATVEEVADYIRLHISTEQGYALTRASQ
ncbi:hypothetical protein M426DRAFT_70185, partial [Hypoxylon sp. CI-4A]